MQVDEPISVLDAPAGTRSGPAPDAGEAPGTGGSGDRDPSTRQRRRQRRRRRRRVVLAVLLAVAIPVGYSYEQALTYPGSLGWQVRTIEWVRDHGGGGAVDDLEVWYYTRHQPPTTGRPPHPRPAPPSAAEAAIGRAAQRAGEVGALHPAVASRLLGEGVWKPSWTRPGHQPGVFTTWFQPDPKHPVVTVGVLSVNQDAAAVDLVAGTREPGHGPWPGTAQVPVAERDRVLAAFNSGFKMSGSHGGFYEDGHTSHALQAGAASLVIYRNGRATVGEWGRGGLRLTPQVHAVRQNLDLIVDHGRPAAGLVHNWHARWGSRKSQLEYVWRSAVGVDARGRLIYVGGNMLTLQVLANALVQAGAVRGMELDIHEDMVSANLFTPTGHGQVNAVKLLPHMPRPATRYLEPDQRDFFTVVAR